ncbi:MAG: hypothetical protein RIQ97_85 [Pseudomonadota bacterium]
MAEPHNRRAKALALLKAGQTQEGMAMLQRLLSTHPRDAISLHGLGAAHLRLGALDEASESLQRALQIDPTLVVALNDLNLTLRRKRQHEAALALLGPALQRVPHEPSLLRHQVDTLMEMRRFDEALPVLEILRQLAPHDPEVQQLQSICATLREQYGTWPARQSANAQALDLPEVTLVVVDGVDHARARQAFDHCRHSCRFGAALHLSPFAPRDEWDVQIPPIDSLGAYSDFMIRQLALHIRTTHVLVAQWDGFVWHPEMWDPVFLTFDYVGAPWYSQQLAPGVPPQFVVGNGGFSLRSKRLLDFLCRDQRLMLHPQSEDVTICQYNRAYLEASGFRFAPPEVAQRFAIENGPLKPAFGVHARLRLLAPAASGQSG